jgi:hypothetical protein
MAGLTWEQVEVDMKKTNAGPHFVPESRIEQLLTEAEFRSSPTMRSGSYACGWIAFKPEQ